jgi:hypothetical protein
MGGQEPGGGAGEWMRVVRAVGLAAFVKGDRDELPTASFACCRAGSVDFVGDTDDCRMGICPNSAHV